MKFTCLGVLKTSSSPEPARRPLSYTGGEDFSESLNSSFGSYPGLSDNTPAPKGTSLLQLMKSCSTCKICSNYINLLASLNIDKVVDCLSVSKETCIFPLFP